jgi:hypothetical protein
MNAKSRQQEVGVLVSAEQSESVQRVLGAFHQRISGLKDVVLGLGTQIAALAGVGGIGAMLKSSLDLNAGMENTQVAISAMIRQSTTGFMSMTEAMQKAGVVLDALKAKAIEGADSFDDLSFATMSVLPSALAGGVPLESVVTLSDLIMDAVKGVNPWMRDKAAAMKVRELAAGDFSPDDAMAKALKLDAKEIADAKQKGELLQYMTDKLKAFGDADEYVARQTLSGRMAMLGNMLNDILTKKTKGFFDAVSNGVATLVRMGQAGTLDKIISAIIKLVQVVTASFAITQGIGLLGTFFNSEWWKMVQLVKAELAVSTFTSAVMNLRVALMAPVPQTVGILAYVTALVAALQVAREFKGYLDDENKVQQAALNRDDSDKKLAGRVRERLAELTLRYGPDAPEVRQMRGLLDESETATKGTGIQSAGNGPASASWDDRVPDYDRRAKAAAEALALYAKLTPQALQDTVWAARPQDAPPTYKMPWWNPTVETGANWSRGLSSARESRLIDLQLNYARETAAATSGIWTLLQQYLPKYEPEPQA